METSLNKKGQMLEGKTVNSTKSYFVFTLVTVLIIILFGIFIVGQQTSNLEANLMNELSADGSLQYEHIGGTEQIRFYLAEVNNEKHLVRVNSFSSVIDSFNLTERPEAGEYFKENYQINL